MVSADAKDAALACLADAGETAMVLGEITTSESKTPGVTAV
jgi:hypothetical protein